MTGYRSKYLRWKCPLDGCYIDALPCWDDLIESFPDGIRPTDFDGLVERGRRFLVLEEKRAGVSMPDAQRKALLRLAELPAVTVVIFRPMPPGDDVEVLVFGQGPPTGFQRMSRAAFCLWLRRWAETEAA